MSRKNIEKYPKKIIESLTKLLKYSDIKLTAKRFLSTSISFTLGLSLAIALYLATLFDLPLLLTFIGSFITLQLTIYAFLILKADAKGKFVENILPDALQLMASNLRAGLTVDRALLLSARPEFGPLKEAINRVGKQITAGKEMSLALVEMSETIKSENLEKTMLLISSGLKSGGELTELLEQTARNLRQQKIVDGKIRASVLMYVIFIFSAIGFGAPMLFALSSFLVEIISKNLAMIEIPKAAALPINISVTALPLSFVLTFIIVILITTSILGSFILGLISKGKETAGIKFIPILLLTTIAVFLIIRFIIKNMFAGLFGL